jgi:Iron-sulfur cluster assembly accessory protein
MAHNQTTATQTSLPVVLLPGAISEFRRLAELEENAGKVLRIGVKGGGCAGFSYILEYGEAVPEDTHFEVEGLHIVVDLSHELYLKGTEIDYQSGLSNRGFTFSNPNAESTCGCGQSFG